MRLWLLERTTTGFDEVVGFVVRALDEQDARTLASLSPGDEGKAVWLNPNESTCAMIRQAGTREIVLRSFLAG